MLKNAFFHKIFFTLCVFIFAAWCVTAPVVSGTAYAAENTDQDALYEPVVVAIEDDPTIEDPWENVTYEKTSGVYQVLLCGVSEANQDVLADAILANLQRDVPVKFTNQSFVDAEKYSVEYEGFDKYHCWLGSTSNILTLTGWAECYFDPIEGSNFTDEDDVLAFMTSSFQDKTCEPTLAYAYFFDGMFGGTHHDQIRLSEPTSNKPFIGTTFAGFDAQVGYANLVKRVECGSNLDNLGVLEELQDYALELSISGATAHSVTVTGVVIDTSKTEAERYVAILIADSDNDASDSSDEPATYQDAKSVKSAAVNSYTMYHLSVGEADGHKVALIDKYMKYKDDAYIGSFTQVEYFSYFAREDALETAENATCNAKTTGDISLYSIEVFDKDFQNKSEYTTADQLQLMAIIMSMNTDVAFNTATTQAQILQNRIEVYRDGTLVGTITDDANVSLADSISGTMGTRLFIDLSNYDFMKTPGSYTMKFYLNTGNITQAYVSNDNSPQSYSFSIVEAQAGSTDNDTGSSVNEDAGTSTDKSTSDSRSASSTDKSSNGSLAETGDSFGFIALGVALMMVLSGWILLMAARKR